MFADFGVQAMAPQVELSQQEMEAVWKTRVEALAEWSTILVVKLSAEISEKLNALGEDWGGMVSQRLRNLLVQT